MKSTIFIAIFGMFFGVAQMSYATPSKALIPSCCQNQAACCVTPDSDCCIKADNHPSGEKTKKKNEEKKSSTSPASPVKRNGSVFGKRYTC